MLRPTTLLACLLPLSSLAQTPPARHATVVDLSGAVGPTLNYGAVAGWRLWGLDEAERFQVGLGLRGTYFFAGESTFDAQYVPNKIFPQSAYTLSVIQPRVVALNAALHLRVRVAGPVHIGGSLDVLGFSIGPEREALISNTLYNIAPHRYPRPVGLNLLLGGSRDRGSLNSELYAAVSLSQHVGLRAGFSHVVTAFRSDYFFEDAGRYRRFFNLASLGLSYEL